LKDSIKIGSIKRKKLLLLGGNKPAFAGRQAFFKKLFLEVLGSLKNTEKVA
jgi:hypothetical protein